MMDTEPENALSRWLLRLTIACGVVVCGMAVADVAMSLDLTGGDNESLARKLLVLQTLRRFEGMVLWTLVLSAALAFVSMIGDDTKKFGDAFSAYVKSHEEWLALEQQWAVERAELNGNMVAICGEVMTLATQLVEHQEHLKFELADLVTAVECLNMTLESMETPVKSTENIDEFDLDLDDDELLSVYGQDEEEEDIDDLYQPVNGR